MNTMRGSLLVISTLLLAPLAALHAAEPKLNVLLILSDDHSYTPPPPPPAFPLIEPDASGAKTIREQLAKHRENATCASCHQKIAPFGFALENFDAAGGWRTNYSKDHKIDSSGDLPTGEKFKGVTDFRSLLIARHEQFTRSLAQKLLTYAIGREPSITDRTAVDAIVKDMRTPDRGLRDMIHGIVASTAFQQN